MAKPERRWITMQFAPSAKPRVAAYAVLDFDWSMTPERIAQLEPRVTTEPVIGALVQHLTDDHAGLCDSRVVWAVQHGEWADIVSAAEYCDDVTNMTFLDVVAPDELPEVDPIVTHCLQSDVIEAVETRRALMAGRAAA